MIQWISMHYSTKKKCVTSIIRSLEHSFFTYYSASCVLHYVVSNIAYSKLVIAVVSSHGSHAVSIAVSLTTTSAVADTISAVLALGHLLGLSVGNTEIADGHDAAILAAHPHIGTLFLAAE